MICHECKTAGALKRLAAEHGEPYESDLMTQDAQAWHLLCKGFTWCDCQHSISPALNQEMMQHGAS